MANSDLLKKEEEFHKLNEQLEKRTRELMDEFSVVKKLQDNLALDAETTKKSFTYEKYKISKYCNDTSTMKTVIDGPIKDVPESVNEMGFKGMSHFYKAKLKKLQEDFDKLQSEYKNKCEEVKKLNKENQKLIDDKEKWFQVSTCNKTYIAKLEQQITNLHSKLQSKETERNTLKKENEQLQKDLKNANVNATGVELRLNRANEECEKAKNALKIAKQEEKDLRESHRKEITEMTSIVKKIEKHRNELITGFKKQLQLIDNLKRQKAHIEDQKLSELAENDFFKILDWKLEQ